MQKLQPKHGMFPTPSGIDENGIKIRHEVLVFLEPKSNDDILIECICGTKHTTKVIQKCRYIVLEARLKGWKLNREKQNKLDQRLSNGKSIKLKAEKIRKEYLSKCKQSSTLSDTNTK